MASSKKFFTDDMTAEEIINLGDDILSKLDKRDLQRAVRTTALVANKRLKRLKAQAKHEGGFKDSKYVEKVSAKHKIALDALNNSDCFPVIILPLSNSIAKKGSIGFSTFIFSNLKLSKNSFLFFSLLIWYIL